jgi:BCD family chlorophyll transporter-like MFS transporter
MGEILTASVWNRVMITELGARSTPVALLLALQYLLVPVSIWAGHRSDTIRLWGYRRTSYIWLGRFLVLISFPLLGLSIREFEVQQPLLGWAIALVCFSLFGVGKLMSGSVYLALVRESVPPRRAGIAITLAETSLIALFVIMGIVFGRWMPTYDQAIFWQMIIGTTLTAGFFWWFALVRVEKREVSERGGIRPKFQTPLAETFRRMWGDSRTRGFFYFLSLSTMAAWMQDVILEPLGGDLFNLETGDTSQFVRYWGGATILTLLFSFIAFRNRRPQRQNTIAAVGLTFMAGGIGTIAAAAFTAQPSLLYIGLVIYGAGFGLYTFGSLSMMAAMSPARDAGAYLGLWTVSILIFKGLGTFLGGLLRDVFIALNLGNSGEFGAYGLTFALSSLGLILSVLLLRRVDIAGFVRDNDSLAAR